MAIPDNYIDKITKGNDSRMISPAADMVRVDNENFEGTDLDEVLDEVAQAIGEAGEGGYAPPAGGIPKTDLASDVQASLGKADTALQSFTETDPTVPSWAKQPTKPTYTAQEVGALPANTSIPSKTSDLNNDSGFVTEAVQSVTVTTNGDGTVAINVDDDTCTINLNHTHEGMAKLVVDTAANLPDVEDMESDTIYGEVEDGEISVLYVGGIPFYGGGAASSPVLRRPADGMTIDMGLSVSGSVSKTINVKGNNLTQALTVELDGAGYTFGNTQPTGVTIVSTTELTVTASAANALNGVDIVMVYTNDLSNQEGTLGISSTDSINIECTLVVSILPAGYELCEYLESTVEGDNGAYINTGVKATNEHRIVAKIYNTVSSNGYYGFIWGTRDANSTHRFEAFYSNTFTQGFALSGSTFDASYRTATALVREVDVNKNRIIYGGSTITASSIESGSWTNPYDLLIGCYSSMGIPTACAAAKYYYLKIYNGNTLIRDYIPAYKTSAGKYGLYDLVNGTFVSSLSGTEFSGLKTT